MAEARTREKPKTAAKAKASASKAPAKEVVPADKSELAAVMAQVNKSYGSNIITMASAKPAWRHLPTGIFTLDMALLGGIPEGLGTMIYGWQSSGKTTIATRLAGAAQRKHKDKSVCYLDIEGTYDPLWGAKHGVNNDALYLIQPDQGEQALDIADAMIRAKDTSLIVIDSLPALIPMKEVEGAMEDQHPGIQARLIGKFLRKVQQAFLDERKRDHWPTLLLINQWRYKIGVTHGDPRVLPGGVALGYVHSVGIEVMNKENTDGKTAEGSSGMIDFNEHSFRIKKNKTGASLRSGEFRMIRNPDHPLGEGFIDDADTVVTFGRRFGLISGEGGSKKRVDGIDQNFDKFDEISAYFYSDLDFYEDFKLRLIGKQRAKVGLSEVNFI